MQAVTDIQGELFTPPPCEDRPVSGFVEIVFDRPLDHAYTYAIPESPGPDVAVGKRVLAPFGRGDRPAIGYCVGLIETRAGATPSRKSRRCSTIRP